MFLTAHPEKGKTAQEKADMDKTYMPGANVIPHLSQRQASHDNDNDPDDQRILAQVRELSLDHVGLSHQSSMHSLTSLLSQSDLHLGDMEQDIMRHIVDHGLREGIDLNNMTPRQEDAMIDEIVRAYRELDRNGHRRHRHDRDRNRDRPSTHHPPATSNHRHSPHTSSNILSPSSSARTHVPPTTHHRHNSHMTPSVQTHPAPGISTRAGPSSELSIPAITCSRCRTPDIQHSLHYHCDNCKDGNFDICLECYRAGKGCLNWLGFGRSAPARYRPEHVPDSDHSTPHILSARRYILSTAKLEQGLFCDGCEAFADSCYWHCSTCLDGAWGYCNACVEQGKHCTHPLASVAHISQQVPASSQRQPPSDLYPPPLSLPSSAFHFAVPSASKSVVSNAYTPITLTCYCDICHYSIPPSQSRYHCNTCNKGNYDICNSCYHSLVSTGKISRANGPTGWRRCLNSHRMTVTGYEDGQGGPHRIIVRELVGGWALKDDMNTSLSSSSSSTTPQSRQQQDQWRWKENDGTSSAANPSSRTVISPNMLPPPDGGVGLRAQAMWSYFPGDHVHDELCFPRHAIISEVEDINGDWYWGVYCGNKGLFPGNYVRLV
jgi:Zn finger protein HypA/HybF involved in hydrogenase expression